MGSAARGVSVHASSGPSTGNNLCHRRSLLIWNRRVKEWGIDSPKIEGFQAIRVVSLHHTRVRPFQQEKQLLTVAHTLDSESNE